MLKEQFEEPAHSDEPTVMELDYFDNPGVAPVQPFESLSHPANDPRTRYNDSSVDPVGHENSSSSSLGKQKDYWFIIVSSTNISVMEKCGYGSRITKNTYSVLDYICTLWGI